MPDTAMPAPPGLPPDRLKVAAVPGTLVVPQATDLLQRGSHELLPELEAPAPPEPPPAAPGAGGRAAGPRAAAARRPRDLGGQPRAGRAGAPPRSVIRVRVVAVLCDIHGNAPALDAVLAELRADPPDAVVVGGDVAAGPMPHEVLDRLLALPWPVHWVRGNADRCVVTAYDGAVPAAEADEPMWIADAWTAERISRAERDLLAGLPPLAELEVDGFGTVLFCHGTPRSDEERVTAVTPPARLVRILEGVDAYLVVSGHTHRQFTLHAGGHQMVNAGSVGRPYEYEPGAYWLRLGAGVDLRRTAYDTDAAVAAFRELGYPDADGMLARVDPDEVAAMFEAGAGGPLPPESLTGRQPSGGRLSGRAPGTAAPAGPGGRAPARRPRRPRGP